MPRKPSKSTPVARNAPDNVVLTQVAALALARKFIGWQCRSRQWALRHAGGRPSEAMRPNVTTRGGEPLAEGMIVLISEHEPHDSTTHFRYLYLKTQDPKDRFTKVLETLQGPYFQHPEDFSDEMTALFAPDSELAARLVDLGRCVLHFGESTHAFRIPCSVKRLASAHPRYQATFWHNRLFNPNLPPDVQVLMFEPDWAHAKDLSEDASG
jgi:hypothetical protein